MVIGNIPCFESWVVRSTSGRFACKNSVFCATLVFAAWLVQELLYQDVLRKALGLVQSSNLFAFTKRSD